MANKFIGSRTNDVLGVEDSMFNKVTWSEDQIQIWTPYVYNDLTNIKSTSFFNFDAVDSDTRTFRPSVNFNNATLLSLYPPGTTVPTDDFWNGNISIDAQKRVSITGLVFNNFMATMNMVHPEDVLSGLNFTDIAVYLQFETTSNSLYRYKMLLPGRDIYRLFVGTNGSSGGDLDFQVGLKQSFSYYIKVGTKVIGLRVDLSLTFKKPNNDFEPLGVIDAAKFFPQIQFQSQTTTVDAINNSNDPNKSIYLNDMVLTGLPADVNLDSAVIYKYKGRVKMVSNTNNGAHVAPELAPDGNYYDHNYFTSLRPGSLPSILDKFEKVFHQNMPVNIGGFYTDSNLSRTDDRYYSYPVKVFPPTWSLIFDYLHVNQVEKEIQGVWGFQDSSHYDEINTKSFAKNELKYQYPSINESIHSIDLQRVERQGQYDNIHLHGYMGNYKDNDSLVLHSPICGFCCFHVHWRWSALNYDLNTSTINRALTASGDPNRFSGWSLGDSFVANSQPGNPLVPPNQSIKIAMTKVATPPFDIDNVLDPSATVFDTLDSDQKAVWYSADVLKMYGDSSHVILEQGVGFAFRYHPSLTKALNYLKAAVAATAVAFPEVGALAGLLLSSNPSVADIFEIGYRIMHFYNIGTYANLQQVPDGTYPLNNPISMENL